MDIWGNFSGSQPSASTAGDEGLIPGWGTKIPHACAKKPQ